MVRLIKSFKWAGQGFLYCMRNEKNFKLHCAFAVVTIGFGFFFSISATEWMLLNFCIAGVLSMELLNTAIEQLCNRTTTSQDPQIKTIKDVSAAAVFIIAVMAAICGAIIFIPKVIAVF